MRGAKHGAAGERDARSPWRDSGVRAAAVAGSGAWLAKAGKAVYGTRGGPWEPVDGKYGCCYSGNTVYFHLLKEYSGDTFRVPPLGNLRVVNAGEVIGGKTLEFAGDGKDGTLVRGIDRTASLVDTVVAVQFSGEVKNVWASIAER